MQSPPLDWPNGGLDLLHCLSGGYGDEAVPGDA
jgi:hypothetical protein